MLCKFELKGKIIFSKPLKPNEHLNQVREKISKRINCLFAFLDKEKNYIDQEDEEGYELGHIKDGEIIRVEEIGSSKAISTHEKTNESNVNVFLDGKKICSINCPKENTLTIVRKLINNLYKEDFLFYDSNDNYIEKEDEDGYSLNNILNNDAIKIKKNSSLIDAPPPNSLKKENENIKDKGKQLISKKNKKADFSKYEITLLFWTWGPIISSIIPSFFVPKF